MGLKQRTLTGLIWTSAGTLGNGIVSLIVTMILSRILTPYDFALIALLNVFLAISNVIVDSGFTQAIIKDDDPSQTDLSSVFYFNIFLSFSLYLILYLIAPRISNYLNAIELTQLSRVIFLVIIFNSFSIIPNATLNRTLDFGALNKSSVLGSVLAGIISIIMAFTGFGIWALVANGVLLPLLRNIILWYHSLWRPIKKFSFTSIKRYLGFGIFLMFQGIIDAISTNLVTIIIGKVYTKNDLGYFSQGGKMDGYIIAPFTSIIQKVTYPIISKMKNEEERLKDAYRRIVGVVNFAFIPVMFFTIATSENMILTLFGEQWTEAGIYLKIAALGALIFPLQYICLNVVMIKGKTKMMLQFAFVKQIIRILLIIIFIRKGVLFLAIVFSLSTFIGGALYVYLGMRYMKYTLSELFQDLYKTIVSSFICIGLVGFIGFIANDLNTIVVFSIQVIVMIMTYILFSRICRNNYLYESISLILPIFSKSEKKAFVKI